MKAAFWALFLVLSSAVSAQPDKPIPLGKWKEWRELTQSCEQRSLEPAEHRTLVRLRSCKIDRLVSVPGYGTVQGIDVLAVWARAHGFKRERELRIEGLAVIELQVPFERLPPRVGRVARQWYGPGEIVVIRYIVEHDKSQLKNPFTGEWN